MNPSELYDFQQLKKEVEDIRYIIQKKLGGGSADVKANIVQPSTVGGTVAAGSIGQTEIGANAVGQSELKFEQVTVSISAGNPSGTAGVTSGSKIIGWRATGNQDQLVDNIEVSGTTLTLTLAGNATATNTFEITLLKV